MEKNIENFFIKEDIINKMTLFASIFNIKIANYQYVVTSDKRKIIFYNENNNCIGYIMVDVENINNELLYDLDNLKIELFTNLGKVIGNYSPHTSLLSYILLFNNDDLYNKLIGNIKFSKSLSQIYDGFSASLEAFNDASSLFRINFNYFDINGIFSIIKHFPSYEKLEYDIWNGIKINYLSNSKKAKIIINKGENNSYEEIAECEFEDKKVLIPLEHHDYSLGTSIWQKAGIMEIKPIVESISVYCPQLKEFIWEARDLFTIQTMDGLTICNNKKGKKKKIIFSFFA